MAIHNVYVETQHLAEEFCWSLSPMRRIVERAAITKADIQIPIRTEGEIAAVVIGKGLHDELGSAGSARRGLRPRT